MFQVRRVFFYVFISSFARERFNVKRVINGKNSNINNGILVIFMKLYFYRDDKIYSGRWRKIYLIRQG